MRRSREKRTKKTTVCIEFAGDTTCKDFPSIQRLYFVSSLEVFITTTTVSPF